MDQCKVTALANQKGGDGKTVSTLNLGVGLAKAGKKALLVDADPHGSLTISLGAKTPDELGHDDHDGHASHCRGQTASRWVRHHPPR